MKAQKGFTLIELLVVCAIILILVAVIAPSIVSSLQTADETAATTTLKQVANAEQGYHSLYNVYAPAVTSLGGAASDTACPSIPLSTGACQINDGLAQSIGNGTSLSGYVFMYTVSPDSQSWTMSATPTSSYSGRKAFFIAADGTVTYQLGLTRLQAPGIPLGQ